jgi:pyrroline-5-carboxylate reductase
VTYRLGVIGVGIIATYVVKGLLGAGDKDVVVALSPRGAANVAELTGLYPAATALPTNQAVLDQSDWIVVGLLPSDVEPVLGGLRFAPHQVILSLAAATGLERLRAAARGAGTVVRMIPLPFIAQRRGPLVIYPGQPEVVELFDGLGQVVVPASEADLDILSGMTSSMSMFYRVVGEVVAWATGQGLDPEVAGQFTTGFYQALLETAAQARPDELPNLWREMTPGGLNALSTALTEQAGGFALWPAALDAVLARIRGRA